MRTASKGLLGLCNFPSKEVLQIAHVRLSLGLGMLIVAMTMVGCQKKQAALETPRIEEKETASEIADIAKAEVAKREKCDITRLEADSIVRTKAGWEVTVWRLPATPDGYRVVVVSPDKKKIDYAAGSQ